MWAGFDDGGADTMTRCEVFSKKNVSVFSDFDMSLLVFVLRGLQVIVDRGHLHRRRPSTNSAGTRSRGRRSFRNTSCIELHLFFLGLWFCCLSWKRSQGLTSQMPWTPAKDHCHVLKDAILMQQIVMTVKHSVTVKPVVRMVEFFVGMITWSRRRKPFLASTLLPTELCWISSQTATNRWRSDRSKKEIITDQFVPSTFRSSFYGFEISPFVAFAKFTLPHPSSSFTSFTSSQCFGQVAEYLGDVFDGIRRGSNPSCPKGAISIFLHQFTGWISNQKKHRESLSDSNHLIVIFFSTSLGPFATPRHVRLLQGSAAWPNRLWPSGQRRRGADVDRQAFGSRTAKIVTFVAFHLLRCFASLLRSLSCGLQILVLSSLRRHQCQCWADYLFSFPSFHLEVQLCITMPTMCDSRAPWSSTWLDWKPTSACLCARSWNRPHVSETRRTRRKTSQRNVRSAGEFEDVGVSRCVKRFP